VPFFYAQTMTNLSPPLGELRLSSLHHPFNSVFAVVDMPTHTENPYVNAGAIATTSLIFGQNAMRNGTRLSHLWKGCRRQVKPY
jgi:glutaminase